MLGIGICFVLGTIAGLHAPPAMSPVAPVVAAVTLWGASLAILARERRRAPRGGPAGPAAHLALLGALTAAAAASAVLFAPRCPLPHDTTPAGTAAADIAVIGVVASDPETTPRSERMVTHRFRLRVGAVRVGRLPEPARGTVDIVWHASAGTRTPSYGQTWIVSGRAASPRGSSPGAHPAGRACRITCVGSGAQFAFDGQGSRFARFCIAARRAAAGRLAQGLEGYPEEVAILKALVLGYRGIMAPDIKQDFTLTGTVHIFAISGLHVAMVAWMIIFVMKAVRVSKPVWVLGLAPLIVAYTVATGAQPSAIRACVMAVLFYAAPLLGRRPDTLSALAAAAVAILAVAPGQVSDAGFILSFVAVLGLVTICPLFDPLVRRVSTPDPLQAEPESRGRTVLRLGARHGLTLVSVSVAAWLVSAPLSAVYFGRVSLIAVAANMIAVPLSFLILLSGTLSVVLGACVSGLASVFNAASLGLVAVVTQCMALFARVPGATLDVPRPPLWQILCWYAALGLAVAAIAVRRSLAAGPDISGPRHGQPAPERVLSMSSPNEGGPVP